ncbi:HAD family hydrolase [Streptomyces sp. KL116D]|uniref:HAD family hydrolase n=1 Tax=Streptomyces sp. KL116D TaxID=3045152 RepID=UPI00355896F5
MVRRALGNHHVRPDTLLVTSDATQQTVPVAEETESDRELTELAELVRDSGCVLLDFDGPICRLFAGRSAEVIALEQEQWLKDQGLGEVLKAEERERGDSQSFLDPPDPLARLARVAHERPKSDLVIAMEKRHAAQELSAVPTAWPTPYADVVIPTWAARGARLAIATNNSPQAARRYVDERRLSRYFEPHIYGRTADLGLLKPHPHCLNRAITAIGAAPRRTLMVGDTVTDLAAARAAGVRFLGFAYNKRAVRALRDAGAEQVITSWKPVLDILRATA